LILLKVGCSTIVVY